MYAVPSPLCPDVGDEPAVHGERRVDLVGDQLAHLRRQLVVADQPLDVGGGWAVWIADHETLRLGEVERRAGERVDVLAGDHHLQRAVGADLVGEGGGEELLEAELVPEVLARPGHDLEAQAELVSVGFLGTQLDQLGKGGLGDLDDRFAGRRCIGGESGERAALGHDITLSTQPSSVAGILDR